MRENVKAGRVVVGLLVFLALAAGQRASEHSLDAWAAVPREVAPAGSPHVGLIHGRVTTEDGAVYEGRLRWGGDEEALWGHDFNGRKDENPWASYVSPERLPKERISIGAFGFELVGWDVAMTLDRPFMTRFGDIARIEPGLRQIRVTLKGGAVVDLDRFEADDLADGVRVWDAAGRVVDIDEWRIHAIECFPPSADGAGPDPLHGTVHTRAGDFTGLLQWDREEALGPDEFRRGSDGGEVRLRFETIESIARRSPDSALVTLRDGRDLVLPDTPESGAGRRGLYVDDRRYGRVLISWDVFERVDFRDNGTGPGYTDFPPGGPLTGSIVTGSGRRLAGRLVYDLDESETTDTLDAPSQGVHYTLPFGLVASIVLSGTDEDEIPPASVTLHSGEELRLERVDDLGEFNAGLLVFAGGGERAEYVPWPAIERIDFDRPPETYPPGSAR